MQRTSLALLAAAALLHLLLLAGWRWPGPLIPYFFDATVLSGGRGLDFYALYQAGYNARHGADIYEGDPTQASIVVPYFTPYRYLPIVAYTLGAALSFFSPLTAYKLWVVAIELTLLGCVYLTWRLTRDPDRFAPLACLWLCFSPFYLELFMGQFSLVQGALVFGMLLLSLTPQLPSPDDDKAVIRRGGPRLASPPPLKRKKTLQESGTGGEATLFDALWLVSVLWKINTVIFIPALVRLRRYRALGVTTSVVLLTSIPYFLIFPAHARDFWANNFGNTLAAHELGNLGFRQFVFELLAALQAPPALQRLAQLALVGAVLLISLLFTFYSPGWGSEFPRNQLPLANYLSLWLTAFFLVSPQIWEHHYVMLLPVIVVAYWQKPSWLIFVIWLLLALPTPFGFIGLQPLIAANHDLRAFPLEPAWQPLLQHASKAAPTLALWGYFCWQIANGR